MLGTEVRPSGVSSFAIKQRRGKEVATLCSINPRSSPQMLVGWSAFVNLKEKSSRTK
jgi:hypothetical protein